MLVLMNGAVGPYAYAGDDHSSPPTASPKIVTICIILRTVTESTFRRHEEGVYPNRAWSTGPCQAFVCVSGYT
jgi:hypothetical protein